MNRVITVQKDNQGEITGYADNAKEYWEWLESVYPGKVTVSLSIDLPNGERWESKEDVKECVFHDNDLISNPLEMVLLFLTNKSMEELCPDGPNLPWSPKKVSA